MKDEQKMKEHQRIFLKNADQRMKSSQSRACPVEGFPGRLAQKLEKEEETDQHPGEVWGWKEKRAPRQSQKENA